MDDTLIFGPDRPSLWHILQQTDHFLSRHLRQHIRHAATRLASVHTGIPFLGFRLRPRLIRLDSARLRRLCRTLRRYRRIRTSGESTDLQQRAATTFSWIAQAHTRALCRSLLYLPRVTRSLATENRQQPGESWWELEQQPVERPRGES